VLILNQTAMDLLGCAALVVANSFQAVNYYFPDDAKGYAMCETLDSTILVFLGQEGSIAGLGSIAIERYFKIVHSVLHKKYYRRWMLYVLLCIPWCYGIVGSIPVQLKTMYVSGGLCYPIYVWPNALDRLGYSIFILFGNLLIPVTISTYCYGRIVWVIRSRVKVTAHSDVTAGNTPADVKIQKAHQKRESDVIRSLILISIVFFVSYLPAHVVYMLINTGHDIGVNSPLWYAVLTVTYGVPLLDPVLYAWQYESVKVSVRRLFKISPRVGGESAEDAGRQATTHTSTTNDTNTVSHAPK